MPVSMPACLRPPFRPAVHRLALATGFSLLLTQAGALTLGELRLDSALGQPLHARVRVNSQPGEVVGRECFGSSLHDGGENGLPRRVLLDFQADKQGGWLNIASLDSLSEPFATLNLRAACRDGGEVRREYTFLLDPPQDQPAAAIELPQAASRSPRSDTAPPAASTPPTLASLDGQWQTREGDSLQSIAHRLFARQPRRQAALIAEVRRLNPGLPASARQALPAGNPLALPRELRLPPPAAKPQATAPLATPPAAADQLSLSSPLDAEARPAPDAARELKERETDLRKQLAEQTSQLQAAQASIARLEAQGKQLMAALATRDAELARQAAEARHQQWLGLGGLVLAIIGIAATLAAILLRRRQKPAAPARAPAPVPDASDAVAALPAFQRPAQPAAGKSLPQPSYDDDLHNSDMDVVMLSHVASEAAVLAAHGHYDRAVALLQGELDAHPTHLVNWMQLLELHHDHHDASRFVDLAGRFREHFASDALWEKVCQLGRQLLPGNTLFDPDGSRGAADTDELTRMLDGLSASGQTAPVPASEPLMFELEERPRPAPEAATSLASEPQHLINVPPLNGKAPSLVPDSIAGEIDEASRLIAGGQHDAGAAILERLMLQGSQEERMAAAEILVRLTSPRAS